MLLLTIGITIKTKLRLTNSFPENNYKILNTKCR